MVSFCELLAPFREQLCFLSAALTRGRFYSIIKSQQQQQFIFSSSGFDLLFFGGFLK